MSSIMDEMKSKLKPLLTFLIGWPLSILALFFIIKTFLPRFSQIQHNIANVNGWLLGIGVLCFLSYYFIRSIVWNQLLKNMEHGFPLHETMYHWSSSEFKRYIPGNVWSFVGRSVWLAQRHINKKDIAKALLLEQELVLLGCVITALLSLPFLTRFLFPVLQQIPYTYQIITVVIGAMGAIYIYLSYVIRSSFWKATTLPESRRVDPGRARASLARMTILHVLPDFKPAQTFQMLLLSSLAFLFFGLGYYFSISAFVFLHPQDIWSLSGFFVFSLLVGLLSFLTPTGLGVREGMITVGLGKVIPIDIAGFVSIIGRIILVFAEVIFVLFSYLIHRFAHVFHNVCDFIGKYRYEFILGIFITIFCMYFSVISVLRYDNFYTGRFDLGNMDQTIWNTAHGRIFQFTNPDNTATVSRLAFHADFILVLFAPLYWVWSDPKILLIVQTLILACGGIFIYLLTNDILKNKLLALTFAYFMNPSIQRTIMYDFHAVTLATTFLLGAFYFMYKKKYIWFLIFAILAGITKEQIWLITGLMGLYIVFQNTPHLNPLPKGEEKSQIPSPLREKARMRGRFFGLSVFLVSSFMFYFLIWYAIPQASSGKHFALTYFSEDNDSPSALVKGIILSPQKTIIKLNQKGRIEYIKKLLTPVGYLPIVAPYLLVFPAADLTLNLLSDKAELQQIYYQYTAAITPFLFIATVFGIKNLRKLLPRIPLQFYTFWLFVMAVYGVYLYGPLPGSREPNLEMITKPHPDKSFINQALAVIGPQYSVAASNSLGAHLAQREHLYTIPYGVDTADVVVFLLNDPNNQPSQAWHRQKAKELRQNSGYQVLFEKGEFVGFRKK